MRPATSPAAGSPRASTPASTTTRTAARCSSAPGRGRAGRTSGPTCGTWDSDHGCSMRRPSPGRARSAFLVAASVVRRVRNLDVGEVRRDERELRPQPVPQRPVHRLVLATLVRVRSDPPARVDVMPQQLSGQRGTSTDGIQVTATDVLPAGAVRGVGERLTLAELALVPDEIDKVELLRDRLARPWTAAGPADEVEAGIDAVYVVGE